MAKGFRVGQKVRWKDGFGVTLDRVRYKIVHTGTIESINDGVMFILDTDGAHVSARKKNGRWLVFKSSNDYQLRLLHAA